MARVASKLEWLRNRPDFQENPEKQRLLRTFEALPEKVDPLLPWLAREVKKKRLIHQPGLSWDDGETSLQWDPNAEDAGTFYEPHPHPQFESDLGRHVPFSQLAHWGDWYADENHPTRRGMDIMRQTFPDVDQRVRQWEDDLKAKQHEEALQGGNVVHTTPDNWTIRHLTTPDELKAEGDAMGNCVGGYGGAVDAGSSKIYSLRDPENSPHATIEHRPGEAAPPDTSDPSLDRWVPWMENRDSQNLNAQPMEAAEYRNSLQDRAYDLAKAMREGSKDATPDFYQKVFDYPPEMSRDIYDAAKRLADNFEPDSVVQIQGKGNQEPNDEYKARIRNWYESTPRERRPKMDDEHGYNYVTHPDEIYPEYLGENGVNNYGLAINPPRGEWEQLLDNLGYYDTPLGNAPRDQDIEKIFGLAKARGELGEFQKALEGFSDKQQESFDDWRDMNYEHTAPYPGQFEDPQTGQFDVNSYREHMERAQGSPSDISEDPNEAYAQAEKAYEEDENEWMQNHGGMQAVNQFYKRLEPYHDNPQGTFSRTASTPLYFRWVFMPSTGEVDLSTNADHPADVRYHGDLASDHPEPGLVHGYAYRIDGGWRLTDWDHKPVVDPFVIAQVMRKLRATSGPQDASWENAGDDFDRMHLGLPGRF